MGLPADYLQRVYAGVLGKIIGVYLGRPFEGWSYDAIAERLGEVDYYVHDKLNKPLIVTDDDITGTFTFLRALPDCGNDPDFTPMDVAHAWMNYNIEERTILWWGGMGTSTEHTAYLRLKQGLTPPDSGSIATNGKVVAEQIGAQIFIDGWAMVAPGDPERAAELARRAACVSHDGEAIYGAQVLAAMESLAFVESDLDTLLDSAVGLIPSDSIIYSLIADLREWRGGEDDWRKARELLSDRYGYDRYGGGCHMVPNHGLIVLSLLYGDDDFAKTLMIVNTCGWDTDCNSGNVGCLMGIKNGLAGIDAGPDWRGPVADRLYLPTAEGGRAITDAATEAVHIANSGRALAGEEPLAPKGGARFHFALPGSVQGWRCEGGPGEHFSLANVEGHSPAGQRSLAIKFDWPAGEAVRAYVDTFIPAEALATSGYGLLSSPTIYSGQTLTAAVSTDADNFEAAGVKLYLACYGDDAQLERVYGPEEFLPAGASHEFTWDIPDTAGKPIARIGLEIATIGECTGTLYVDTVTWSGTPSLTLLGEFQMDSIRKRAWVDGADRFFTSRWPEDLRTHVVHDEGVGVVSQGTADWVDYRAEALVRPHMAASGGLGVRTGGMRRYYGLCWTRGGVKLVKARNELTVLAECQMDWPMDETHKLALQAVGNRLTAWVDDKVVFEVTDDHQPLPGGGVSLLCEEGHMLFGPITVGPPAN